MFELYKMTATGKMKKLGAYATEEDRYADAEKHGWFADLDKDITTEATYFAVDPDGFEGEMWR